MRALSRQRARSHRAPRQEGTDLLGGGRVPNFRSKRTAEPQITGTGPRAGRGKSLLRPGRRGGRGPGREGTSLPLAISRGACPPRSGRPRRRSRHDGPLHHPQPAGAPAVQVHRDGPRRHHQVGVAGEPAPGLVLLLHGPLRPAQLLRHRREREQGARPLQPHGEDAAALRAARRQARRVLARPARAPAPASAPAPRRCSVGTGWPERAAAARRPRLRAGRGGGPAGRR